MNIVNMDNINGPIMIPKNPNNSIPPRTPRITSAGCMFALLPIMLGLIILSIVLMTNIP